MSRMEGNDTHGFPPVSVESEQVVLDRHLTNAINIVQSSSSNCARASHLEAKRKAIASVLRMIVATQTQRR